jgi:hypothetical protein
LFIEIGGQRYLIFGVQLAAADEDALAAAEIATFCKFTRA